VRHDACDEAAADDAHIAPGVVRRCADDRDGDGLGDGGIVDAVGRGERDGEGLGAGREQRAGCRRVRNEPGTDAVASSWVEVSAVAVEMAAGTVHVTTGAGGEGGGKGVRVRRKDCAGGGRIRERPGGIGRDVQLRGG